MTAPKSSLPPVRLAIRVMLVLAAALAAAGAAVGQDDAPEIVVRERTVRATFLSNGVLVALREARVAATVMERIVDLPVREGDPIEKDRPVVRLDTAVLDVQGEKVSSLVGSARARLERVQAGARPQEVNQARALLARSQAQIEEATADLTRYEDLYQKRSATLKELESIRTRYQIARQDRENARQALDLLEAGPRDEDIEIARRGLAEARTEELLLKVQRDKRILTSPISGIVARKYFQVGEVPQPGEPILHVVDLGELDAEINVEETYIDSLQVGTPGEVLVDAIPGAVFPGKISSISSMSSEQLKMSLLKEEEDVKRFRVKITLSNDDRRLRAGMSVKGRFTVDRKGFFVPLEAVRIKGGIEMIQLVRGQRVLERSVEVGVRHEGWIEIAEGLLGGETIRLWQAPPPDMLDDL